MTTDARPLSEGARYVGGPATFDKDNIHVEVADPDTAHRQCQGCRRFVQEGEMVLWFDVWMYAEHRGVCVLHVACVLTALHGHEDRTPEADARALEALLADG